MVAKIKLRICCLPI